MNTDSCVVEQVQVVVWSNKTKQTHRVMFGRVLLVVGLAIGARADNNLTSILTAPPPLASVSQQNINIAASQNNPLNEFNAPTNTNLQKILALQQARQQRQFMYALQQPSFQQLYQVTLTHGQGQVPDALNKRSYMEGKLYGETSQGQHGAHAVPKNQRAQMRIDVMNAKLPQLNFNGVMAIMSNDEYVGQSFRDGTWWEEDLVYKSAKMYQLRPSQENVHIIDLGANLGAFTVPLAWVALPEGGLVYAFEPQKAMHHNVMANVFINGLPNVHVQRAAAVHEMGRTVSMSGRHHDGQSQSLFVDFLGNYKQNFGGRPIGTGGETVRGVTLDWLNFSHVGFIKADIQGAEPLAFYGARQTILRWKPFILYERSSIFHVSADMIAAMGGNVPNEAAGFNIASFVAPLGYSSAYLYDCEILIPPGVDMEKATNILGYMPRLLQQPTNPPINNPGDSQIIQAERWIGLTLAKPQANPRFGLHGRRGSWVGGCFPGVVPSCYQALGKSCTSDDKKNKLRFLYLTRGLHAGLTICTLLGNSESIDQLLVHVV
eukprot:g36676.t1